MEAGGDEHPDYSPGDLVFVIQEEPHPVYTRRGPHLYTTTLITLHDVNISIVFCLAISDL